MRLYDFTVYAMIIRNALSFGNKEAWFEVDDNRTLTFSQYNENVDRLAAGLQNSGIVKGDCIGVSDKNNLEYFLLYGAAAALGAIMLPIASADADANGSFETRMNMLSILQGFSICGSRKAGPCQIPRTRRCLAGNTP